MSWNDAIRLPYAKSRTPVNGHDHLLRIVADVMDAEQEELPEELQAELVTRTKPQRASTKDGVQTAPPSYRVRVTEHPFPFQALLQRGDRIPQITEVEVLDVLGRVTGTAQSELKSNRDDPAADWRIGAYEVRRGVAKKARVREYDPTHKAKMSEWQGRHEADAAAGLPAHTPAKQIVVLKELPGFTLVVVWIDLARQEEPRRGDGKPSALGIFLDTGHFPAPYQEQRDKGFAILRARVAAEGGSLKDFDPIVAREIVGLASTGSTPERIASLLQLPAVVVKRIINAAMKQPAPEEVKAKAPVQPAGDAAGLPAPKPPRKPRAPRAPKAPEPESLPPER
jgi:hypothetical protein